MRPDVIDVAGFVLGVLGAGITAAITYKHHRGRFLIDSGPAAPYRQDTAITTSLARLRAQRRKATP